MEQLPPDPEATQREPIRLQIFESPSQPGTNVQVLLGGRPCTGCDGWGVIYPDEVDEDIRLQHRRSEVCGYCNGVRYDLGHPPIDIVRSVEQMVNEVTAHGSYTTLVLKTDIGPLDFTMDTVTRVVEGDPLDGLTAKELEQVVIGCPATANVGNRLLMHLRTRGEGE